MNAKMKGRTLKRVDVVVVVDNKTAEARCVIELIGRGDLLRGH